MFQIETFLAPWLAPRDSSDKLTAMGDRMRYSAFISYSHRDKRWADRLHRGLESYRLPKALRGKAAYTRPSGDRLLPVFRDREEFASSADLGEAIRDALDNSATLVVLCSPRSAKSRWVNQEIEYFLSLGRADRIQCFIVDGEPFASADPARAEAECLPPALLKAGREPLAADARPIGDGFNQARLKLLASIFQLPYDALRRRDAARRQRQLLIIAIASVIGLVVTSGLALAALLARNEAVRQRDLARQKTLTAERTVSFVKSMFELADPSEAKGQQITAREILDRGARQYEQGLQDEPAVKAELGTTLGEVYLGLGLFRQGQSLIERTFSLPGRDASVATRQYAALGDALMKRGAYDKSVIAYRRALDLARKPEANREEMVPRILVGLSEAQSSLEQYDAAARSATAALQLDQKQLGSQHPDVARDLEALALNAFFANDEARASDLLNRAIAIRAKSQGMLHPKVTEDLNMLGAIAYLHGQNPVAERYYRAVLKSDEQVLGPNHPDLAITLNNLARVILERRGFAEAKSLLDRAVAITVSQRSDHHDDLAFAYANLALAEKGLAEMPAAERHFRAAIIVAEEHHHRNLAPALTDLADTLCARGRTAEALRLLDRARPLMAEAYPDDAWRTAWVDNVRGGCMIAGGRSEDGKTFLKTSTPVLLKRWPASTLYGFAVVKRAEKAGIKT